METKIAAYTLEDRGPCVLEIPCQSCGKIVEVSTMNGIYNGCVFCLDCLSGQGTYKYREQF